MATDTKTMELKDFCAAEDSRNYTLTRVFSHGGFHYATDGLWVARVRSGVTLDLVLRQPPVHELDWINYLSIPLPTMFLPDRPKKITCAECGGSGKCHTCGGTGKYRKKECLDCSDDFGGGGTCFRCFGERVIDAPPIQIIWPQVSLGYDYAKQLMDAGAKIFLHKKQTQYKPVRFSLVDIEGLLMPVVGDGVEKIYVPQGATP